MKFCNINFFEGNVETLLQESSTTKVIVTVNAEIIVKANNKNWFLEFINDNIATFDGTVPFQIAKLIAPKKDIYKISGSDLIYHFETYCSNNNKSFFLLGGYEDSNKKSVNILKNKGIKADGYSPPFEELPFTVQTNNRIYEKLKSFKPTVLFVGFGAEKQERWIKDNLDYLKSLKINYIVGSGGTFEFYSGKIPRAPRLIQKIGLEGFFRLFVEPKRSRVLRIFKSFVFFKYI
jgi:N-acetylglucosaminyldiphosphoundecaprenol N-acetyl-beta-D-mannosaminyltransferase